MAIFKRSCLRCKGSIERRTLCGLPACFNEAKNRPIPLPMHMKHFLVSAGLTIGALLILADVRMPKLA